MKINLGGLGDGLGSGIIYAGLPIENLISGLKMCDFIRSWAKFGMEFCLGAGKGRKGLLVWTAPSLVQHGLFYAFYYKQA